MNLVQTSPALVAYEGAVPLLLPTRKAMAGSDSQRTRRTRGAAGTEAEAVAPIDVDVSPARIAGYMTAPITIVLVEELQAEVDGKRTPTSWTPRPWAITTGQMPLM